MSNETEELIVNARVRLLLKEPFFGNLAIRLKLIDATNWVPTAGTDGRHLYYNRDFIARLDKPELDFLIGHEVLHCVYDHMSRCGSRDPRLFNCAADFVINAELVDAGFKLIKRDDIQPCYDRKYDGMSTEQVYELLLEDDKNGKNSGMQPLDEHMQGSSGSDGGEDEDPTGANGPIPMSESERRQLEDEIKQAVMQAAKTADPNGKGVPGRVKKMLAELTDPKLNWHEYLNKQIQSSFTSDFTWSRFSRKGQYNGIYLPDSIKDQTISVCVGVDTSGSIDTKKFTAFISEIHGMMGQFTSFDLSFFCWDADTYTMHHFTEDNLDDILSVEFEGGGGNDGTQFVWDRLEEEGISPDNMVMFTDAYILGPEYVGEPPEYSENIVWVVWGSDKSLELGQTVFYDHA